MKIDTVVTLDNNQKYYLTNETEENSNQYFLGVLLDDNNKPTSTGAIFMEENINGKPFLKEVDDDKEYNYLAAIFASDMNEILDTIEEE